MFKWFKKKNNQKLETIFPTAKEMLRETSKNWPPQSPEEILQKIKKRMTEGERDVYFFKAKISQQTVAELRQQGYRVRTFVFEGAPGFNVKW